MSDKAIGGWQDPSTDIENVNAAYRIEHDLANHYRAALERVEMHGEGYVVTIAREALAFDPLSRKEN